LLALGLVLLVFRLRSEARQELIGKPVKVSPRDSRVWPFLVAGFGIFASLGSLQVVMSFVVQDRFDLDPETTGLVAGGALAMTGLGIVAAQAVIVPLSSWAPSDLLRVGALIAF